MMNMARKLKCEHCDTESHGNCVAALRMCALCGRSTWHFATEHFDRLKGLDSMALAAALDALYRQHQGAAS